MAFFELQEVADGVYAAIVVDGAGALGNAGFVNLGEETLVFDTFLSPQAAQVLRAEAERMTGNQIAYVVNSHFHGDHTYGNQVFADATILSTERTRELFLEANKQLPDPSEFEAYFAAQEQRAATEQDERKRRAILTDLADKKVMAEHRSRQAIPDRHADLCPRLPRAGHRSQRGGDGGDSGRLCRVGRCDGV